MRIRGLFVISFALAFGVVGCGESTPMPDTPQNPVPPVDSSPPMATASAPAPEPVVEAPKAPDPPPPPPKKTAKEIVTIGSTFMFSLDDSPDAKKMQDDLCTKKNKKPEKKDACMKDVMDQASKEGIRFEKDDKGTYFVSFGSKKDKEAIYTRVPIKPGSDSADKISFTLDGKSTGPIHLPKDAKEIVLGVPDESTVFIQDEKKGKLTYKKK